MALVAYVKPPYPERSAEKWASSILEATAAYSELLSRGVRMDARYIIPRSVRTRIVTTMNARELIQSFLSLGTCSKTRWELRHIAWMMWRELRKVRPLLFKWAGPRCILVENTARDIPVTVEEIAAGGAEPTIPRCPELVEKKATPLCIRQAIETATLPEDFKREILGEQS